MRLNLSQRLSLAFAALLIACCGVSAWVQVRATTHHEEEVVQRLSLGLAAHIAGNAELMHNGQLDSNAVHALFDMLMVVNPSVEVYVLGPDGSVRSHAAPPGRLKQQHVDTAPIRRLLAGDALPIYGDDPRSGATRKVFSAAPLRADGREQGYVYVILLGEDHDKLAADSGAAATLRATLWSMGAIALVGLAAGLVSFNLITRRLRALTAAVRQFASDGMQAYRPTSEGGADPSRARDEIALLDHAFADMARRNAEQWQTLVDQDQQRRELVANISHDLRTPLTSLHGFLETLSMKAAQLTEDERRRYLDIAIGQSSKVGRLAQELFELASLEHGAVTPDKEHFSLVELVQDVLQKFELAAASRGTSLTTRIPPNLPWVWADLGMIERVLTNLLDNAIRHTPAQSHVEVSLIASEGRVEVEVADDGPGIPADSRIGLFTRASAIGRSHRLGGGLGLLIVHRILRLHQSDIELVDGAQPPGAVFRFALRTASAGAE